MVNFLCDNLKLIKEITKELTFSKDNMQHLFSISLFCTIYENSTACLVLINNKIYSAIPVMLRNILEAHIDLIILSKKEDYYYDMAASYLKERNKILKLSCQPNYSNEYLECLKSKDDIQEKYVNSKKDYEDLIEKGYKALSLKDKFKKADSMDLYLSIYNLLCQDSHNNISSLSNRHFNKQTMEIEIFQNFDKSVLDPYIDSLNGILITSCQLLANILNIDIDKKLESTIKELNKFRE